MDKEFHMAGGEDAASYARNSSHQMLVLREVKPILSKGIEDLIRDLKCVPEIFRVSDLGCSSGPNLFLTAESIIESIEKSCQDDQKHVQYFINDLVSNDFNLVFKGLPEFYEKVANESCRISAIPGSFYSRLFPDKSMHFQHSSYCLHWLSQIPSGLMGAPENKGMYCAKTASPRVQQAYSDQFSQDFSKFLSMRSRELVQHGQLLLTFICKNEEEPEGSHYLSLLNMTLIKMVSDGFIAEEKLDSFSVPYYESSVDETRKLVEKEGSFKINRIHTFKTLVGAGSGSSPTVEDRARFSAKLVRAAYGPTLAAHFGDSSMDNLFKKYENILANAFKQDEAGFLNNMVISLSKQ